MEILIRNSDSQPIYEQIVRQISGQILSGALPPGSPLPSIRALARDLKILTGLSGTPAGAAAGACDGSSPDRALYKIQRIREVDNFCHSMHVETCCLLRRRA